jgi:hypothetical protein
VPELLIVNGCSFTRGAELPVPAADAWPALLARRLGVPLVSLARDGASNRRIVRTSASCIGAVCRERGVAPAATLVLVAWTSMPRAEFFAPRDDAEGVERPPDLEVDRHWQRIGPWRVAAGHAPSTAFYDHLWSEAGQLAGFLLDWLLLDAFLRGAGFDPRYAYSFPVVGGEEEPARRFVELLAGVRALGGVPPRPGAAFHELAEGHPRGPTGHPLEAAHRRFEHELWRWLAQE